MKEEVGAQSFMEMYGKKYLFNSRRNNFYRDLLDAIERAHAQYFSIIFRCNFINSWMNCVYEKRSAKCSIEIGIIIFGSKHVAKWAYSKWMFSEEAGIVNKLGSKFFLTNEKQYRAKLFFLCSLKSLKWHIYTEHAWKSNNFISFDFDLLLHFFVALFSFANVSRMYVLSSCFCHILIKQINCASFGVCS